MSQGRMKWRTDIQGLRAIAVGLVFAAHAGVPGLDGGFIGVDVFFVISGFLITSLLLREKQRSGRISVVGFYARRARRILPASTLTIVAVLVWSALNLGASQVKLFAEDGAWSAFFLANVHFASVGVDYFAQTVDPSPFQHYWSLAVEEQFYLVWPLLISLVLTLLSRRRAHVALLAVIVVSFAWSCYGVSTEPQLAYFSSFGRGFELAIGGLLAFTAERTVSRRTSQIIGFLSLAALAFATVTYSDATPFPGAPALVPVLAAAGLILAGQTREDPRGISWLLGQQPFRYLGDISFSLYLWHWPVLILSPTGNVWSDSALAFACAIASYHLVEKSVLSSLGGRSQRWSLVLWPTALAVVVAACLGSVAHAEGRVKRDNQQAQAWFDSHRDSPANVTTPLPASTSPSTLIDQAVSLAEDGAPIPPKARDYDPKKDNFTESLTCFAQGQRDRVKLCPTGDLESARTLVLFGDSHANTWVESVRLYAQKHGIKVIPLIKLGCAPYDVAQKTTTGEAFTACASFRTWAMDKIGEIKPDAVVLAARGLLNVDAPAGKSEEEAWAAGVDSTLTALSTLTPTVAVFADYPSRPQSPTDCLTAPGADQESCIINESGEGPASNLAAEPVVRAHGAHWVDITDIACSQDRCPLVVGENVLYRDSAHLSPNWLRLNQAHILEELQRALASL